jgi:hypothetical protein
MNINPTHTSAMLNVKTHTFIKHEKLIALSSERVTKDLTETRAHGVNIFPYIDGSFSNYHLRNVENLVL